jgi:hypothetical protein
MRRLEKGRVTGRDEVKVDRGSSHGVVEGGGRVLLFWKDDRKARF